MTDDDDALVGPPRLYFPCCQWWMEYRGWPDVTQDRGALTCSVCGHWLVFFASPPRLVVMGLDFVKNVQQNRPELARDLLLETAMHVRRRPCCHAAWGDA